MPLFSAKPPDSWDSPCREVLVSFCGISDLFLFLCGEAFLTVGTVRVEKCLSHFDDA